MKRRIISTVENLVIMCCLAAVGVAMIIYITDHVLPLYVGF